MDFDGVIPGPDDFRQGSGDNQLVVMFYMNIMRDEAQSIEQGRPIFNDTEFVKIFIPGDKTNVLDRPASPQDKQRFAVQYARFQQGIKEEDQISGTPLKEWPLLTRAQVEEFKYFNIHTVEHLADVNDAVKLKMTGITKLSQQAKIWLERTNATAEAAKLSQKLDAMANKIEVQERNIAALIRDKEALQAKLGEPVQ